jgi:hypothetical protein
MRQRSKPFASLSPRLVIALCGWTCITTAPSALAGDPFATMGVLVRRAGEVAWSREAIWAPNTVYEMGIEITWSRMYAFRGATFQVLGSGLSLDDTVSFAPGTISGRITEGWSFGSSTNAIYRDAETFRIDAAGDPDNSSTFAGANFQQRPNGAVDRSNPVIPFRFDLTTGSLFSGRIDIDLPRSEISRGVLAGVFEVPNGFTSRTFETFDLFGASIVIPGAPSASLLLIGAAGVLRRARKRPD